MFGLFRMGTPTNTWDLETHTKFYFIKHLDVPHQYTRPVKHLIEWSASSLYHAATQRVVREVESRPYLDKTWIKVLAILAAGSFFPVMSVTGLLEMVVPYLLPPLAVFLVVYQFCAARQPSTNFYLEDEMSSEGNMKGAGA